METDSQGTPPGHKRGPGEQLEPGWIRVGIWKVEARLLTLSASRRCDLAECRAHCCGGGVWIDVGEAARIIEAAEKIKPQLPEPLRDEELWFDGVVEADSDFPSGYAMGTRTQPNPGHPMGTSCVFLRPDYRCALQVAGEVNGQRPWEYKPYYCALHPITQSGLEIGLDAENEIYTEEAAAIGRGLSRSRCICSSSPNCAWPWVMRGSMRFGPQLRKRSHRLWLDRMPGEAGRTSLFPVA